MIGDDPDEIRTGQPRLSERRRGNAQQQHAECDQRCPLHTRPPSVRVDVGRAGAKFVLAGRPVWREFREADLTNRQAGRLGADKY